MLYELLDEMACESAVYSVLKQPSGSVKNPTKRTFPVKDWEPIEIQQDEDISLVVSEGYQGRRPDSCPACGRGPKGIHAHPSRRKFDGWRCTNCRRVFRLPKTNQKLLNTRHKPRAIVWILRGIAEGVSTAQLSRELRCDRKQLAKLRKILDERIDLQLVRTNLYTREFNELFASDMQNRTLNRIRKRVGLPHKDDPKRIYASELQENPRAQESLDRRAADPDFQEGLKNFEALCDKRQQQDEFVRTFLKELEEKKQIDDRTNQYGNCH